MNHGTRHAERKLRDYPISLRQSARAVYGDAIARDDEEKRAADMALADASLKN